MNQPVSIPLSSPPHRPHLALWGGTEYTSNRVGDSYYHQLDRSRHAEHIQDLDRFATLGIAAMRYPILWERIAPVDPHQPDWAWSDSRLARLRELGIRPIVGLLHHGSGPRYTSLLDCDFPTKFANYARQVAQRYPDIDAYTPINEPLTTARFSGLYGVWYPHGRNGRSFARALLNQICATVLAMQEIRKINPAAQLVQTEDLGKIHSTPTLAYQAEFENYRRWLTIDLLTGRVNRQHPMWNYLGDCGIAAAELEWLLAHPCPPDILGGNYYVTSERWLDERLALYPTHTHGGNGLHTYADVEAVRVPHGIEGPKSLLREAWQRYGLPLAVTEVQMACTREEQMRWLAEVWGAAQSLQDEGVDIRAVTAWALLGAFDWDSLLTEQRGHYEPGTFDLRAPTPRPTALAKLIRQLAAGQPPTHPVLDRPGWWRRRDRVIYDIAEHSHIVVGERRDECLNTVMQYAEPKTPNSKLQAPNSKPVLIVGATGTLGRAFARACLSRGISYRLLTRAEMDIASPQSVAAALDQYQPWAVINAAGYVRVDEAEREVATCLRENSEGPVTLAAACATRNVQLLTFSSDLVFDGNKATPYLESDTPYPLNVYGRSKVAAERQVLGLMPSALVVRTSAFFSPHDRYNFVTNALQALSERREFVAASDVVISPTYVPHLVDTCLDLLIDDEHGIWHLANAGVVTWAELAHMAAAMAGLDTTYIVARPIAELGLAATRPRYAALVSERGWLMPSLDDALAHYLRNRVTDWHSTDVLLAITPPQAQSVRVSDGTISAYEPAYRPTH